MSNKYTLKVHGSASKSLLKEVTSFVEEIIDEFSILYEHDVHRDAILEVLEECLEELAEAGRITQYNVICDNRNNNQVLADAGITNLDITYKQDNCYVTTSLHYVIISDKK
jgi:hypothetical protein